jgi:hypothetical protein
MTIERKQRILCSLTDDQGEYYYSGPIDGIWGPASQEAADHFMRDFAGDSATDTNIGCKEETGTFWDEIEFFTADEVRCKCGGKYCGGFPHEVQPLLMEIADRARRWSGHPIVIISGLRCDTWNELQGGVENSQHKFGEALDVYFYGVTPEEALAWLQSQPEVRYAYRIEGSDNIHFDIYPVGR